MSTSFIKELTKRAKEDPAFFHALVFEPNKIIEKIKNEFGDPAVLSVKKLNPSAIIAAVLGWSEMCGPGTCGSTCQNSCTETCGPSCAFTGCGDTCGVTSQNGYYQNEFIIY